jgi:hypothetical protein
VSPQIQSTLGQVVDVVVGEGVVGGGVVGAGVGETDTPEQSGIQ